MGWPAVPDLGSHGSDHVCCLMGLTVKPLNLKEIGGPGEDRTPDPMVANYMFGRAISLILRHGWQR